jgi:hypothetical protein
VSWLEDYANTASKYADAPTEFQRIVAYWTFGAAVGRRARFQFGMVPVYTNLYLVLVGRSGIIKKSVTKDFALDVLDVAQPELDLPGRGSPEAFRDSLEEKNWYGVLHYDEMYEYLSSRRKDYRADMDTTVMELFAHGRKTPIRTKVSGEIRIPSEAMISFIAPTTLDMLIRALRRDDFMSGKMARFLFLESDQDIEYPVPPPRPQTTVQYLGGRLKQALPKLQPGQILDMKETPEARKTLEDYYFAIKTKLQEVNNPLFAGSFSRAQVYAIKLAMIHALANGRATIEADDYGAIMPYISNWAKALEGMVERISVEDRFQELILKAETWLKGNPHTTQGRLQSFMRLRKYEMIDVIEHLKVAGHLTVNLNTDVGMTELIYRGNGQAGNGQKVPSEGSPHEAPPKAPVAKPKQRQET